MDNSQTIPMTISQAKKLIAEHIFEVYSELNDPTSDYPLSSDEVANEILSISYMGSTQALMLVTSLLESAGGPRQWQADNTFIIRKGQ
jgi:hypothetical protein